MHYACKNQPITIASFIDEIATYITDKTVCDIIEKVGYEEILFDTLVDKVAFKIATLLIDNNFKPKGYWAELALLTFISNVIDKHYSIEKETKINFNSFETYDIVIVKNINNKPKPKMGWRARELKENRNIDFIKIKGQRLGTVSLPESITNFQDEVSKYTHCKVRTTFGGFNMVDLVNLHAILMFQKEYKSKTNESEYEFKARLTNDALVTKKLVGKKIKYTTFYDSRGRDYASLEYGFIKPYGNKFESRILEQESYRISSKGLKRLKWFAVCLSEDIKISLTEGVKRFNRTKLLKLRTTLKNQINQQFELMEDIELGFDSEIKPITPKELGNILYLIDAIDASMLKVGQTTRFYLEIDMVNSGLIHFSNMFRSCETILKVSNLKGRKRMDSHTVNLEIIKEITGKKYTRDEIKKLISQPLFHGSRLSSIAKNMSIDEKVLNEVLEKTYPSYKTINEFAEFGKKIHLENNPAISWTMPDGFVSTSVGYSRNNMITVKVDDRKYHLNVMMPLLTINKFPYKSRDKATSTNSDVVNTGTLNKGYGLWANIVHSFDSYALRNIKRWFIAELGYCPMTILDDFKVKSNDVDKLIEFMYDVLDEIYSSRLIHRISKSIEDKYGVKAPELPEYTDLKIDRNKNILSA